MKKKIKYSFISILAAIPVLGGCIFKKTESNEYFNKPNTGSIVDPNFHHDVAGTTHIFNSVPNFTIFGEVGKKFNYSIYYNESNEDSKTIALHLKKHFGTAFAIDTGAVLPAGNREFNQNEKAIYVCCDKQYQESGLTATAEVGKTGYTLKSKGDSIFLNGLEEDGLFLGANNLLNKIVGFDCYMNDFVTYERTENESVIYSFDFDDAEIPDYQYRVNAGWSTSELMHNVGNTSNPIINKSDYPWIHNVFSLLGEHYDEHPEWFDEEVGYRPNSNLPVHQLCYYAHGDAESRKLMVATAADRLINLLVSTPGKRIVTITAEDTAGYCKCDTCRESIQKYKTEAGSIVQFINDVDDIVGAYFKNDGSYKGAVERANLTEFPVDYDYTICFFAYHNTVTAPANFVNGEFVPIDDSVVGNEHVGIMMAPSKAKYIYSFYDERNKSVADECKAWASCIGRVLTYLYSQNWRGFTFPYNSFDADVENMKFFKELNSIWMFDSANGLDPCLSGFMEYKKYLINKAMINVNIDVNDLTDRFFRNVYGPAKDTMLELYHSERAHCLNIANVYIGNINDDPMFEGNTGKERWPIGKLLNWWGLCDKGMEQIENIRYFDINKFNLYRKAILLESISPRFAMIELHGEYYSESDFKTLAKALKNDMLELRITYVKEHDQYGPASLYFEKWGV